MTLPGSGPRGWAAQRGGRVPPPPPPRVLTPGRAPRPRLPAVDLDPGGEPRPHLDGIGDGVPHLLDGARQEPLEPQDRPVAGRDQGRFTHGVLLRSGGPRGGRGCYATSAGTAQARHPARSAVLAAGDRADVARRHAPRPDRPRARPADAWTPEAGCRRAPPRANPPMPHPRAERRGCDAGAV